MSETCSIIIDGRPAQVPTGTTLLEALRRQGVHVPTLCHHPSLEASGACRLCLVEITHPDWGGWSGLVASCLYAVEPGLQVATRSRRVTEARRTQLELYLAACPESELLRAMARDEGIDETGFALSQNPDLCIHCGLCTRVCQELGPEAIAALGRGTEKTVGPRPDLVGEDCTGCLACAHICPTGHIRTEHQDGRLVIWSRDFPVQLCDVVSERCRGCGVCEEVCPYAIPRVVAQRSGRFVAEISPQRCVGCGICAGACPTGAIVQTEFTSEHLTGANLPGSDLTGRTVTFACSRSAFSSGTEDVIPVPCIGRVTIEGLLTCLAHGADGALLMCRDQATCPYGLGGRLAGERATVADQLAAIAGLGAGRILTVRPEPGAGGPDRALAEFRSSLVASPLQAVLPPAAAPAVGLDLALELMRWFKSQPGLSPVLPPGAAHAFEQRSGKERAIICLSDLPELDLLLSLLISDWRLAELLTDAADLLERHGIVAVAAVNEMQIEKLSQDLGIGRIIGWSPQDRPAAADRLQFSTLDELAAERIEPHQVVAERFSKFINQFRFQISPEERHELVSGLTQAASPLRCASPYLLAQLRLLTRRGAWRSGDAPEPIMAFQPAARTGRGGILA